MNIGVVALHMDPSRSGVDAAVHALIKEWRSQADITLYSSRMNPAARLDGVNYVKLRGVPCYSFNVEAITSAWSWRKLALSAQVSRHDLVYSEHPLFTPSDALTVHFCCRDYRSIFDEAGWGRTPTGWGRHLYHWVENRVACALEHRVYGHVTRESPAFHVVSKSLGEALERCYPGFHSQVIPNPVDVARFSRRPDSPNVWESVRSRMNWRHKAWRWIFVGGGWERKGLAQALEALSYEDPSVVLMVVGKGPEASYRKLAEQWGVASRVCFAGSQSDVASWYASADVFVFPSRYEAMPVVCIEALASGLPILCMPFKGTEMFLENGKNGYRVSSPVDIADRSRCLRLDPDGYASMSAAAAASVSRFDSPRVASEMLDFIQDARSRSVWRAGKGVCHE